MPSDPISQSHLTDVLAVGSRVVVRCRLAPAQVEPGGPTLTDVVGDVTGVTDDEVVIDTRRGAVAVDRASIVLAKRIPQPPPRRRPRRAPGDDSPAESVTREQLETLMVGGMPPLDSARIGDWLLRTANGYTGRANSVLAVGDPGVPLADAIDRVVAWYGERRQPALVQLPHGTGVDPAASPLGSVLAQRNWRFFQSTLVMTRSHATVAAASEAVPVDVAAAPTTDWWSASSPRALEHRATLEQLLTHVQQGSYLTAYLDGRPVGHARLAFSDGWSGVFDIHTDPGVRRRGVATALMSAASRAADDARISWQYLQVSGDNDPAVRLYESLGWRVHHEYHYARKS